jgi:hypothetical protein
MRLTDGRTQMQNAAMKMMFRNRSSSLLIVAGLVLGGLLSSPAPGLAAGKTSPNPARETRPAGRLVIMRSASLGPTVVGLRIDGVETAKITFNRRYDAPLAAGQHVLTVYPLVSREGARPTDTRVNVESGKTYTFTAARQDIQIVLQ